MPACGARAVSGGGGGVGARTSRFLRLAVMVKGWWGLRDVSPFGGNANLREGMLFLPAISPI